MQQAYYFSRFQAPIDSSKTNAIHEGIEQKHAYHGTMYKDLVSTSINYYYHLSPRYDAFSPERDFIFPHVTHVHVSFPKILDYGRMLPLVRRVGLKVRQYY